MQRSHYVTARHAPGNVGKAKEAPMLSEPGVDAERRMRQLALLQEWRGVLDRAGYGTLLSLSPPMLLQVRMPNIEDRWIALSPNGLLIVFEKNDLGGVRSDYHLLPNGAGDSTGPSARVALQAATKYLLAG